VTTLVIKQRKGESFIICP